MAQPPTSDEVSDRFNQPSSTQQHSDEDSESFNEDSESFNEDSESLNQLTQTPRRKRKRKDYSENVWPKRMKKGLSNILVAEKEGMYDTVESVIIQGKKYTYNQYPNCKYDLTLCHKTLEIDTGTFKINIPCEPPTEDDLRFDKAKFLYKQVKSFPQITDVNNHHLRCRPHRRARLRESDSDDEHIIDHEVLPEFDDVQLAVVNVFFKRFFAAHEAALKVGLFNAVGKEFLDSAWEYLDLCQSSSSKFKYLHNTAKGKSEPGAMFVKWSLPQREFRSSTDTDSRKVLTNERYADHIVYDKVDIINVCVLEVKEKTESPIEAQNNEQMLGLWKGSQQVMLGLEVNGYSVRPKILALIGMEMQMFYLEERNINKMEEFYELLKLMAAFLICVNYKINC